jgi:hypothetical protein
MLTGNIGKAQAREKVRFQLFFFKGKSSPSKIYEKLA